MGRGSTDTYAGGLQSSFSTRTRRRPFGPKTRRQQLSMMDTSGADIIKPLPQSQTPSLLSESLNTSPPGHLVDPGSIAMQASTPSVHGPPSVPPVTTATGSRSLNRVTMQPRASRPLFDVFEEEEEDAYPRAMVSRVAPDLGTSKRHTFGYTTVQERCASVPVTPLTLPTRRFSKQGQQNTKPIPPTPRLASFPEAPKATKTGFKLTPGDSSVSVGVPAGNATVPPPREINTKTARIADGISYELQQTVKKLKQTSSQLCDLQEELRSEREKNLRLEKTNQELEKTVESHKEEKLVMQRRLKASEAKEISYEAELRVMHLKLARAEKAVRALDHVTSLKVESRISHFKMPPATGQTRKPQREIDVYVVFMVEDINDVILETALAIANAAVRSPVTTTKQLQVDAIRRRLGVQLSSVLSNESQNKISEPVNLILVQTVVQVLLVHWCVDIIEAHYPPRKTFSDLLIEMTAQSQSSTSRNIFSTSPIARVTLRGTHRTLPRVVPQPICGRQSSIITPSHSQPPFKDWSYEILNNLSMTLCTGNYVLSRLKSHPATLVKLEKLLKVVYDLRLALAEKDRTGGLEILVVQPDTEYIPRMMEDAHLLELGATTKRKNGPDGLVSIGTSAIGLQREEIDPRDGGSLGIEIVLRPKVVLSSTPNA